MKNRIAKIKICLICGIETCRLGVHIKSHNLSQEDYYSKYISKTTDRVCHAEGCSNLVKFQNLNIGYTRYCSTKCCMVDRNSDVKFKSSLSTRMKSYSLSKEGILSSEVTRNERSKSTFLTKSRNKGWKIGLFYVMEFPDWIKIGVCAKDENLINLDKRCYTLNPDNYIVFEGTIEDIANYEYLIKKSYIPVKNTEYFDKVVKGIILKNVPSNISLFLSSIKRSTTIL